MLRSSVPRVMSLPWSAPSFPDCLGEENTQCSPFPLCVSPTCCTPRGQLVTDWYPVSSLSQASTPGGTKGIYNTGCGMIPTTPCKVSRISQLKSNFENSSRARDRSLFENCSNGAPITMQSPKKKHHSQNFSSPTKSLSSSATKKKNAKQSLPFTLVPTGDEALLKIKYQKGRELGRGSYGRVFELHKKGLGNRINDSPARLVVKRIDLLEISRCRNGGDVDRMRREVAMLRTLDHPNIVKTHEVYAGERFLWPVMELCSGGELLSRYIGNDSLNESLSFSCFLPTESELRRVLRYIFEALAYLHYRHIAHRDIKPENFMWASQKPDAEIKLIDFGLASYNHIDVNGKPSMTTRAGTPLYVSPEIVHFAPYEAYGCACDCWSAGVILHLLLTGNHPFNGDTDSQTLGEVVCKNINWNGFMYQRLSEASRHLLGQLLQRDPHKRISAEQALEHPWIKDKLCISPLENIMTAEEGQHIIKSLCRYQAAPKLKKFALMVIAKFCDDEQICRLREIFRQMDHNHNGTLSIFDIKSGLQQVLELDKEIPREYFNSVLQGIAADGSGRIEYSEFIAAALSRQEALIQENLEKAFIKLLRSRNKRMNREDTIKVSDLQRLLSNDDGEMATTHPKELRRMIQEVSSNSQSEHLSLKDFQRMIKNPYLDKVHQNFNAVVEFPKNEVQSIVLQNSSGNWYPTRNMDLNNTSPSESTITEGKDGDIDLDGHQTLNLVSQQSYTRQPRFSDTMAKLFEDSLDSGIQFSQNELAFPASSFKKFDMGVLKPPVTHREDTVSFAGVLDDGLPSAVPRSKHAFLNNQSSKSSRNQIQRKYRNSRISVEPTLSTMHNHGRAGFSNISSSKYLPCIAIRSLNLSETICENQVKNKVMFATNDTRTAAREADFFNTLKIGRKRKHAKRISSCVAAQKKGSCRDR